MTKRSTVLFLGAGKLWQLMRRFQEDARTLGVELDLHAIELDPFCPIAEMAQIHVGPKFSGPEAAEAVLDVARRIGADLVIPAMDNATVLLAGIRGQIAELGAHAVVSDPLLCSAMHDKLAAEEWFARNDDLRPMPTNSAPAIAKHRFGYASKGIYPLITQREVDDFLRRPDAADYLIQEYVDGDEFTVDAFVSRGGRVVDILSRQRLVVEAGIVLNSRTRWHDGIIATTEEILSRRGWQGPITLQYRLDGGGAAKLIEINPRFGGGVTHSIYCGLRMPKWLI